MISNDSQSEAYLLARMLASINAVNESIESLRMEDFSEPIHASIFGSMCSLYSKDCKIDPIAVVTVLKQEYPKFADAAYVFGLKLHQHGSHEDVKIFIETIREASRLRRFASLGHTITSQALSKGKSSNELQSESLASIESIFSAEYTSRSKTIGELIQGEYAESGVDFLAYMDQQIENHRKGIKVLKGLPTGYSRLDEILNGFCKGHYIIIGARPGIGKTTLALNFIYNLLMKNVPVGFFSLEMTAHEAMKKLIGIDCGLNMDLAERGQVNDLQRWDIGASVKRMGNLPLVIDDQESLKVSHLISRAKRMVAANKIEILFIDYLGEVKGDGKFSSKQEEIQSVSKALRAMAKSLRIPVVIICQLNREVEKEKRAPRKSDLRESGQIEADAHSIMLLDRPSVDNENDAPGAVNVHIVKNRFGKEGFIKFAFDGNLGKFAEIGYSSIARLADEQP